MENKKIHVLFYIQKKLDEMKYSTYGKIDRVQQASLCESQHDPIIWGCRKHEIRMCNSQYQYNKYAEIYPITAVAHG